METFSRGTLDPWYVTGFSEGEGSFTYSRSSSQIALYFLIKLTATDRSLLEAIQDFFGVGKIYQVRARDPRSGGGATKSASLYRVTRHDELGRITDHFDEYALQGCKAQSYKIWRAMVTIKRDFRGRNRDALEELALALSASQPRNQSWR